MIQTGYWEKYWDNLARDAIDSSEAIEGLIYSIFGPLSTGGWQQEN